MTYCSKVMSASRSHTLRREPNTRTYGDEQVRHLSLILLPRIAILLPAPLDVPHGAMCNHAAEEDGVEPREGAAEARDEAPADGEEGIAGVVQLAGLAVPAIDEEAVPRGGGDLARVLDGLPGDLGERVALGVGAALHGPEAVLLAVAAVPDPVDEEVRDVQADQEGAIPAVLVGGVVGEVDDAVAVGERDARHVPEDEHEPPFLVVHVPGRDDELLALAARVGVQPVRHHQEHDLARHVAVLLVLAHGIAHAE